MRPLGQFSLNPPPPQDPTVAITGELRFATTDSPGLRVASTTGRRTFHGGGVALQRFVRPPAHPNSEENLAPLLEGQLSAAVARRTYGRARGLMYREE